MDIRDRLRAYVRHEVAAWRAREAIARTSRFRVAERRALRLAIARASAVVAALLVVGAGASTMMDPLVGWELFGLNAAAAGASIAIGWTVIGRGRRHVATIAYLWGILMATSLLAAGLTSPLQLRNSAMIMPALPLVYALFMPWTNRAHLIAVGWTTVTALVLTFLLHRAGVDPVSPIALSAIVTGSISVVGHAHRRVDRIDAFRRMEELRGLHLRAREAGVRLSVANRELASTARVDALTGAGNRRLLEEDLRALDAEPGRPAVAAGQTVSALVLVDLDRFKSYNDRHGHVAGDWVLRRSTDALREALREADRVYRYGGEELLVILADVDAAAAEAIVGRMLLAIQALDVPHPENRPWKVVTASAGWALQDPAAGISASAALLAADEALYRAKRFGRNRAVGADRVQLGMATA